MRATFAAAILLLIVAPIISQSISSGQPTALLEITLTYCIEGCSSFKTLIYVDGRVISEYEGYRKAKSGRLIKISRRDETRLEPEELAELMRLTEQSDFIHAQPEYVVKVVTDNGETTTVIYSKGGQVKKIVVGNYLAGNDAEKAKLPPSLLKLIKLWYEFPNSFGY